jgi:hypothetical protein
MVYINKQIDLLSIGDIKMNEYLFFVQIFVVAIFGLVFLRLGKEALVSFVCVQGILSNLLVTKQISLFSFDVTCSDVFAVGALMSLNLLQEYYGRATTQRAIWTSFAMLFFYLFMTQVHVWYLPNTFDSMHRHFAELFSLMPRLTISSIGVYVIVQQFDALFFGTLKKLFDNRFFALRSIISLTISQLIDTILFSFFALYGVVGNIGHIIAFSFVIKLAVIVLAAPLIALTKKIVSPSVSD